MDTTIPDAADLGDRPLILIKIGVTFLILTWTAFTLRLYVRTCLIRSFGWDDGTMILALTLFTVLCACLMTVARIETGEELRKAAEIGIIVQLPILDRLFKIIVVAMGLYLWTTVIIKISLAIFFLRLITKQWHRNVIYVTTAIYTLYGVSFAFIGVFQCGNPNNFLANEILGKCLSDGVLQPMNYVSGAFNAITDWIYVFFPLYVVWNAHMPLSAKFSAGILLGFAAIGSISSLVRIAFIPGLKPSSSFFSHAIDIAVWSIVEPGIAIFTASLATLRPLFKKARQASRNIKSLESSGKSNSTKRSRSAVGRKIPASAQRFSDRGVLSQQVQDPESGIVFDMAEPHTSGKRLTELREMGYDLEKVRFIDEQEVYPPMSSPYPPSLPPPMPPPQSSIRTGAGSGPSNSYYIPTAHAPAPDRAYVKGGKVVIRRPSDPFDDNNL